MRWRPENYSTDHDAFWHLLTGIGVLAVAGSRLAYDFANPLPIGMDAAHYANQTRSILETGQLWKPDLPVAYYLFAAIAAVLRIFGMDTSSAALLGSRVGDAVIPALMAIPAVQLARWSSRGTELGFVTGIGSILVLATSPGLFRMISDFQKNSVALTIMSFAVLVGYIALQARTTKWILLCAGFVAVAFLSHIGGAAATMLIVGFSLVAYLALDTSSVATKTKVFLTSAGVAAAALLAIAIVAPHKMDYATEGLPRAFNNPATSIFNASGMPPRLGAGGPMPMGMIDGTAPPPMGMPNMNGSQAGGEGFGPPAGMPPMNGSGPGGEGFGPPPGMPPMNGSDPGGEGFGPPPGMPPMDGSGPGGPGGAGGPGGGRGPGPIGPSDKYMFFATYSLAICGLAALGFAWRFTSSADRIVAISTGLTAMMLACPYLGSEFFWRTVLMSVVPATLTFSVGFGALSQRSLASLVGIVISAGAVILGLQVGGVPKPRIIDSARLAELKSLKSALPKTGKTVLFAQHGVEYWAQFALGVHSYKSEREAANKGYTNFLRLEDSRFSGQNEETEVLAETKSYRLVKTSHK